MNREDDWLWLCAVPGLTWKEKMVLLRYFGSPGDVRHASGRDLAHFEQLGADWIKKLYPCMDDPFLSKVKERMEQRGVLFASAESPAFPKRLSRIADCPYGLFYRGRLPGESPLQVGIVGARACSAYGKSMARQIGSGLARIGIPVISGMAMGIDGIAQRAALEAGGESYAVLGCGAENCYPRTNIDLYTLLLPEGGILSEFPCGTPPLKHHFPARNRLIAGLCDVLAVIEARAGSGSLITAGQALDQGRDVYALPGRTTDPLSEGCNDLIRDGAMVITSAESFVRDMQALHMARGGTEREGGADAASARQEGALLHTADLTPAQRQVWDALTMSPAPAEKLCRDTGLPADTMRSCLLALVLSDLALEVGKNCYVRKEA